MPVTLTSLAPMDIARTFVADQVNQPLLRWGGEWWAWRGERWCRFAEEAVADYLWNWLDDATFMRVLANNSQVAVPYEVKIQKVREVQRAIQALVTREGGVVPMWLDGIPAMTGADARHCVGFRDVVVDVRASAKAGSIVSAPRTMAWFDNATLRVDLDGATEPKTWIRCLQEWSGGDPAWMELLERYFGYCLMGTRKHAKWLLQAGLVRGGKGTATDILKKLVGQDAFIGTSIDALGSGFGLDGMEKARVAVVSEVGEPDRITKERVSSIIKAAVGGDTVTVDVKYQRQRRDAIITAALILQANEIPMLSNKGTGVSSKMLVLPYRHSFLGKENLDLSMDLAAEMGGIAKRLVEAAIRLEASKPEDRWPKPETADEMVRDYHLHNNPLDAFLVACFEKDEGGFVSSHLVREEYRNWMRANNPRGEFVADNMLLLRLERDSSWGVKRKRGDNEKGKPFIRGMTGLRWKGDQRGAML